MTILSNTRNPSKSWRQTKSNRSNAISNHLLFSLSVLFILYCGCYDSNIIPFAPAVVVATPDSLRVHSHCSTLAWGHQIRGGSNTFEESEGDDDNQDNDEKESTSKEDVDDAPTKEKIRVPPEESEGDDNQDKDEKESTSEEDVDDVPTKEKIRVPLYAPFRMNEVVKEEASVAEKPSSSRDELTQEENATSTSTSRGILVGGAMVKEKPPPMVVVDTSRVAPMSSPPLLQDPEASQTEEEEGTEEPSPRNMTDMAKLWWVNVWTQQLSDMKETSEEASELVSDSASQLDEKPATYIDNEVGEQEEEEEESDEVASEEITDAIVHEKAATTVEKTTEAQGEEMEEAKVDQAETKPSVENEYIEPEEKTVQDGNPFVSSGLWRPIDNLLTFGLASNYPSLRFSRKLRAARKMTARVTGLHGLMSGKPSRLAVVPVIFEDSDTDGEIEDIRQRIAAIDKARQGVERAIEADARASERRGFFKRRRQVKDESTVTLEMAVDDSQNLTARVDESVIQERLAKEEERLAEEEERLAEEEKRRAEEKIRRAEEEIEEKRRMERVKQIDSLIVEGQGRLQELICEKDVLQRRPNPLFNYTTEEVKTEDPGSDNQENDDSGTTSSLSIQASRKFKFPPDDLVEEYLDMIFSSRRLTKMNHTYLWKDSESIDDDEDDTIGDDLLTPSADAHKLYQDTDVLRRNGKNGNQKNGNGKNGKGRNGGGGSWLLRQTIGKGPSLGEKIGEAAETAAYQAVCSAVMSFLARTLSSLHGINVMQHSDIRLVLEQAPDLPPVGKGLIPGSSNNYAQETIKTVMRRKARKLKKRSKFHPSEDSFVQRDAVTEMLLSHVQISAPLLKLFPLEWQRALLGNIITLATAVMSDFFDGLQFQILGHQLSFSFKPITEEDMINHFFLAGGGFNHRRAKPEEFEAAVRATAEDVGEELKFLDRWHERALGSGVLRTQIANLIARIVLTLTDEVLSGARMDLWSQAGGPRMLPGLEYRTKANY